MQERLQQEGAGRKRDKVAAIAEAGEWLPATNRPEGGKCLGKAPPAELGTQAQSCLQGGLGVALYRETGQGSPPAKLGTQGKNCLRGAYRPGW